MPHVVVIGGGFGGLSATETLAKEGFRVTLIDRHPYNTFQPLLYQVATGGLNAGDVTYSLRYFSARYRNVSFRRTTAIGLDHEKREVLCDDGVNIGYDYLIVANGITTNHFGIPGAAEYSVSMYTRAEALRVRDMIFGGIETIAGMSEENTGGFTVVVVGGGATGVEIAGQLAELKSHAVPVVWPELNPALMHVVLVEMGPALLAPFDDKLRRYTLRELVKRGVDVRLKTAISEVHADRVDFKSGQTMQADLVIWAAGVSGYPLLRDWGLPLGRGGRIEVNSDLRTTNDERVFAVGDTSVIVDNPLPQLAQPALQTGKHAARQITRIHLGQPTEPFEYYNKGTMATIGRADAVVQLPNGLKLTGLVAWLGWIALHIMFLLGSRNRIQTLINLAVRYSGLGRSGVIVGDVAETPRLKAIKQK
ncbi:MAG TPA: NAD(P)/FAD-dependent oxidoreductase [Microlunatus sp.]|nr:NAD(P)/FAD-dependent oxidoreductase [Microlunatus sp.]